MTGLCMTFVEQGALSPKLLLTGRNSSLLNLSSPIVSNAVQSKSAYNILKYKHK